MIKFKKGNIISLMKEGKYDVFLHGLNCHCRMSDGLALEIAKNFPLVEEADLNTKYVDRKKLGTFVPVNIKTKNNKDIIVLNCYTQFNYAGYDIEESDIFEYEAFRKILKYVSQIYEGKKIAMPLIGTGHAGGDMDKIISIIKDELSNNNVNIIVYGEYQQPKELNSIKNKLMCYFS